MHRCPLVLWIGVLAAPGAQTTQDSLAPPPVRDFTGKPSYSVVRATDGGHLQIVADGQKVEIRLAGVDIPAGDDNHALESRAFLDNLLRGESVFLEFPRGARHEPKNDAEAYVFRSPDGLFVNLEVVRQGYGRTSASIAREYSALFRRHQSAAAENERGLWGAALAGQTPRGDGDEPRDGKADPTRSASRPPPKAAGQKGASNDPNAKVFITPNGKKYHRPECQFVAGRSTTPMTSAEARQKGYTPCTRCDP